MNVLLVLPIVIPFLTAICSILGWSSVPLQRLISLVGMAALLSAASLLLWSVYHDGIQATQIGDWPAPIGITVVADVFSALMVTITALMAFMILIYSLASMDADRQTYGYYPLYSIMVMGVCGAFLTGDLFNLYVWFELLLISSFVLLALGGERKQLMGALQYVTINLVSSTIFLTAVGMTYSVTGTLNMADLSQQIEHVQQGGMVNALAVMFLMAFGIKAAMFPLFFWLPVSYDKPPIAVTAIFAALLTKVGVYALVRVFTLIFVLENSFVYPILLVLSGFTMVSGVLGAASEYDFRRVLSFHIVSQIGYMLMGLALFTPLALAGTIFFMIHNILAKANLFLISGLTERIQGTYQLKQMGGLYKRYPLIGVLFLIPALALAGIPPLSGFWGKYILVRAGLETEDYLIITVSLFVSVWTLYSMMKIWTEAFWKDDPAPHPTPMTWTPQVLYSMVLPIVILASLTVLIGLFMEPVFQISLMAGEQLADPSGYVQAVLGGAE